jgi:hypothetical protein
MVADYLVTTVDYLLTGQEKSSLPFDRELSEDTLRLLNMYGLLTDLEKGEVLGQLKEKTAGRDIVSNKNAG